MVFEIKIEWPSFLFGTKAGNPKRLPAFFAPKRKNTLEERFAYRA